jgi:hypothetical protein
MINKLLEDLKQFLRTPLIITKNVYIDLWSFVHLWSGYILYSVFGLEPLLAWIAIIGFKLIEPNIERFKVEHPADTMRDILFGLAGYYIAMGGGI